jgi:thiol:disulfide interchange protein DsbD
MNRETYRFKANGATLGNAVLPAGKVKFDDTFQKNVETYRKSMTIKLPVQAATAFTLMVTSQGCADKGLCYAPMDSEVRITPFGTSDLMGAITAARGSSNQDVPGTSVVQISTPGDANIGVQQSPVDSELGRVESSLKSGKLLVIIPWFLIWGLGLAFTPCVLPMVPILSRIILGEGATVSRSRSFALSVTYSLGMALVYTLLGVMAGLLGEGLSASLQNPWVLGAFALLMIGLSLSMFGAYELQMPASIQAKLIDVSGKQKAGKMVGVFIMGALSALIVGPCVAAPLAGALTYLSQTRDVLVGGSALFAMAIGMSVPLLLVGISAGTLLPRAGPWMESVKRFFGVMLLGLALWMVAPVIPVIIQMLGWVVLGIGYGLYLVAGKPGGWVAKAVGVLFALFGVMQLVGVASGGRDPLAPLAHLGNQTKKIEFVRLHSVAELDAILAKSAGKTVLLDFYADWCVACKEMEKLTFTDPDVREAFSSMLLLQADVTANTSDDKALLKRFNLFGPPGIIFFGKQGQEVQGGRVIGYQAPEKFLQSLSRITRM